MDVLKIKSNLYDYEVEFVDDFAAELNNFGRNVFFVIDKNVYELYREKFSGIDAEKVFFMDADEHKKNISTVMEIISRMQEIGVKKNWKIICFGGGITQDVTTLAANLFLRNVDWYFFPTTLLSMCDSCIGGKCGINYRNAKNQLGVFYPPKKIFIDTHFIDTLSKDDYINGWGEILKFSLTSDPEFYAKLKSEKNYIPCENIAAYIHRGLLEKKRIIEEDEFESDLRRLLNYGHTFGHALEAYTGNKIPHGKGVIWGIDVANFLSLKEGLISEDFYLDVKSLIRKNFITEEIHIAQPEKLFELIKTDKKFRDGKINFALLETGGRLAIHALPIDERTYALFTEYLTTTHGYYCGTANTIAIDCGGSFIKAALFSADGEIIKKRYEHRENSGTKNNISALVSAVQKIFDEFLRESANNVRLCISNEMHGFILADTDGTPVTDYISWQKEYGKIPMPGGSACEILSAPEYRADIINTGMPLRSNLPSANLLYLKKISSGGGGK